MLTTTTTKLAEDSTNVYTSRLPIFCHRRKLTICVCEQDDDRNAMPVPALFAFIPLLPNSELARSTAQPCSALARGINRTSSSSSFSPFSSASTSSSPLASARPAACPFAISDKSPGTSTKKPRAITADAILRQSTVVRKNSPKFEAEIKVSPDCCMYRCRPNVASAAEPAAATRLSRTWTRRNCPYARRLCAKPIKYGNTIMP